MGLNLNHKLYHFIQPTLNITPLALMGKSLPFALFQYNNIFSIVGNN